MQTVNDIRAAFLGYFSDDDHKIVESSPLVPRNDPTLMFTNSGMVQFKNVFTGLEQREYSRAVTSQKCVRAGGKHNDLENVGHTTRHHTFFEMLGNFSFGDYFKEHAIHLAWNLITKEFGIPKEKLLATVYVEDEQAFDLWKKIAGFNDRQIIRIKTSDNFWAMGDTGPCGPCSEIFYDHGDHISGGPPGSITEDGDRFIEIWNLVFMQYEQISLDQRIELPRPSIDTGMGLERIAAVMQGTHDNYDIDMMVALIDASAEASQTSPDGSHSISHRVVADHLRASSFLISDGVLPSNEGRGYVLRRIMRRAMRHAQLMGCKEPLMHRLVPVLVEQMNLAYPELSRAEGLITDTFELEETRFMRTLGRGLKLLDEATEGMEKGGQLCGETAFKLYDTYGFPLDLTQDALKNKGIDVDTTGFEAAMERQREETRKAWVGSGEAATEKIWFEILEEFGATEFLGYDTEIAGGQVLAIVKDGVRVADANEGENILIVTNQSPFYGESGGQIGDAGVLRRGDSIKVSIVDTQKKLGLLLVHEGRVSSGRISVGDDILMELDHDRRSSIRANHSVTHLIHEAIRRRLGEHVTQKGSLVGHDRMRFDVSTPKPISPLEIREIETDVNEQIRLNATVTTRLMEPDAAIDSGAMALFGEKYGDEVRVVTMGHAGDDLYSIELCGGTHVDRTGDIGICKIVSETGVAAGVRRIEVVAGRYAEEYFRHQETIIQSVSGLLKVATPNLITRVKNLIEENKQVEYELTEMRRRMATSGVGGEFNDVKEIGGIKVVARILEDIPAKELKSLADEMKKRLDSGVVVLISSNDGKASLVVGVTDDLISNINAINMVRVGSKILGGSGGGGRPDMAQAGGPDVAKIAEALVAIEKSLT